MLNFAETIAQHVPKGHTVKALHVQLAPLIVKNLIPRLPSGTYTNKIRHFCLFINPASGIIFVGIEVLVYLVSAPGKTLDQYIFVSKCDTTGLERVPGIRVSSLIEGVLKFIVDLNVNMYDLRVPGDNSEQNLASQTHNSTLNHLFYNTSQNIVSETLRNAVRLLHQNPQSFRKWPHYQSEQVHGKIIPSTKLKSQTNVRNIFISLFARAAPQYLFPSLAKAPHKHLLSGEKLVAWWLNVIDRVTSSAGETRGAGAGAGPHWQGRLMIPGADARAIERFLAHFSKHKWLPGCIFAQDLAGLAVASVPLFPDDPKGRFLEHIVVEERYRKFTTLAFYHELGYRQEFRTSDIVGLLGCSHMNVPVAPPVLSQQLTVSLKEYKAIVEILQATDFSSKTDAIKTVAERIPGTLKKTKCKCAFVDIAGMLQSPNAGNIRNIDPDPKPIISLNHLVKRKKPKLR